MPFFRDTGFLMCSKISATCGAISLVPWIGAAGIGSGADQAAILSAIIAALLNLLGTFVATIGTVFQRDQVALWFIAANVIPLVTVYAITTAYFGWH